MKVIITANTAKLRTEVDKASAKIKAFGDSGGAATESIQKGIGNVTKVVAASAAALGLAVVGVGAKAVSFSDDLQKSLNGVQTATGTADGEMQGLRDSMLSIYNNNFGDDFADIGEAMKLVANGTGLTGKALEGATQNALLLRDTFGFEVESSVKGADALMKQFGMTSDASFNLMAQGAQNGLDKNGDLLDTLNEYSGTFAAQGFSATEMFNMLSNASKSGVRDVDLAADAIKEFGIRSKDGSDATAVGFAALGLNATDMTKQFAQGGEVGQKAFQSVTEKLIGMKDPVAQTAAGVALFGTQFEDLGIKGIAALTNTKGSIDSTKDSLTSINAIKYNSFGEGLAGIGRIIMTSVLIPLGEKLIPKLQEFSQYIMNNMPQIKSKIDEVMTGVGAAFEKIGPVVATLISVLMKVGSWVKENIGTITDIAVVLGSFAIAFTVVTGAVAAWAAVLAFATPVTGGFAVAMAFLTSPIGLVVLAITAVIAIGVLLWKNWDVLSARAIAIFNGIKTIIVTVFTAIGSFITAIWDGIKTFFQVTFEVIKIMFTLYVTAWMIIIQTIFNVIKTIISTVWNWIKTFFVVTFTIIKAMFTLYVTAWMIIIQTVFNVIKTVVTSAVNVVKTVITTVWNGIKSVTSSVWNGIQSVISTAINGAKSTVSSVVNGISSTVSSVWNGIKSTTTSVWNGIKTAIMTPVNAAKEGVRSAIEGIKGFFSNLKLSIPKISIPSLPKLKVTGKFSVAPPSIPSFNWYAKGGEFNQASIIGVGENGSEAVVPLEKNTGWADRVADLITSKMGGSSSDGSGIVIKNVVINNDMDIQTFAEKLQFFTKQQNLGRG